MTMAPQPESPANEIEFLVNCLEASRERFLRAVEGVSESAANVKIGESSWSILHCAEHVATAERQMMTMWNKLAAAGKGDPAKDAGVPANALNREKKNTSPERSRPNGRYTELSAAIADFRTNRATSIAALQGSTLEGLRGKVVTAPARRRDRRLSALPIDGGACRAARCADRRYQEPSRVQAGGVNGTVGPMRSTSRFANIETMAEAPKLVNLTVDGKAISAPAGTLLIEACKSAGVEIPSFCYYPNLSVQGACRMCLVKIEKMPKLQTSCTTVVGEGMIVTTENDEIHQARKSMLELLLANHPLDCPVCDAGGQCELQDMTFTYGAAESKFIDIKNHRDEQQWSPVVYFDRPRCILCYRCVRVCGEGMDVWALGIQQRGVSSVIAPNQNDHLECEECGMCIDICPVGALTSGSYRYKTRPWEMNHVGTVCTHCGDGCKTTLGRTALRYRHGDRARRQSRQERHQRRLPVHQGTLCLSTSRRVPSASLNR